MRLLERWRAGRELRRHAPLTERSLEGARVRATGTVRKFEETMYAPLSGRECVIAYSRIRGTGYHPAPELLVMKAFVLETTAAPLVVDGGAVLLAIAPVKRRSHSAERRKAFVTRFGIRIPVHARFEETLLALGDRVTVGGALLHDVNPEPPRAEREFREGAAPRLRLVGGIEHPLVIVPAR